MIERKDNVQISLCMKSRSTLFVLAYVATVSSGVSAALFTQYLPVIVGDVSGATDKATIGMVGAQGGAAFLLGWAVGAVLLGRLADVLGRKRALLCAIVLCTAGVVGTSFVSSVPLLIAMRALAGFGAGSILLLGAVMVAEAWQSGARAKVMGILANSFPVGLIISGVIAVGIRDWRAAHLSGGLMIVIAIAVLIFVDESSMWVTSEQRNVQHKALRDKLFSREHRKDLAAGVILFGSMLVGLWAAFVWMPTWVGTLGDATQSSSLRSITNILLGVGSVAGGFGAGQLADRVGRKRAAAIGYVGCALTTALIFIPSHSPGYVLYTLTVVLALFIGNNQGVLIGYIPELFPTPLRGFATGVCYNAGRVITVVAVLLMGVIITMFGGYDAAILTFGGAYLVGLAALTMARETRGRDLPA